MYPSVSPLESWSKYKSFIAQDQIDTARNILFKGDAVRQMMKVVGEEGTSLEDFLIFLKAEFFGQLDLIREVVGHHHDRRAIEAFDQKTALVIGRKIHRAAHTIHAGFLQFDHGDFQKPPRNVFVVNRVKKAEEPGLFVVILVVAVTDADSYTADNFAILLGQIHPGSGRAIKRIEVLVEELFSFSNEGGHEILVARIESIGEPDKSSQLSR